MPELPDVVVYCDALNDAHRAASRWCACASSTRSCCARSTRRCRRSRISACVDVRRLGKRIVIAFDDELFLVIHLMVAGRLRWLAERQKPPGRITLALFDFPNGTLALTEAGTKRRASLHVVRGAAALARIRHGRPRSRSAPTSQRSPRACVPKITR